MLIVGVTEIAKRFVDSINRFSDWGLRIVGFLVREASSGIHTFCSAPILGTFQNLAELLHQHPVDEVIFALPTKDLEDVREMMDICEVEGVKTRIISNFFSGIVFKAEADVIHGIPIITYSPAPRNPVRKGSVLRGGDKPREIEEIIQEGEKPLANFLTGFICSDRTGHKAHLSGADFLPLEGGGSK